ncbi:hypothetical protein LC040_03865 [Bacillus tianshenii]|nr:hypothetical protein LC040_03865 [Bacillus tianshenii]
MNTGKRIFFYIGNIVIGIFSYYAYLYFWFLFSWGESFPSAEAFLSVIVDAIVFFVFNVLLLRKESKKHWSIAIGTAFGSLLVFVAIFAFSA